MYTGKIAIPTNTPGGIDGQRSDHFGHCEIFTLVAVRNGHVQEVSTLANVPHQAGGCMAPVGALNDQGVNALVVSGMGGGPFKRCEQVGIGVYFADPMQCPDVRSTLSAFLDHRLPAMQPLQLCKATAESCHGHAH